MIGPRSHAAAGDHEGRLTSGETAGGIAGSRSRTVRTRSSSIRGEKGFRINSTSLVSVPLFVRAYAVYPDMNSTQVS